RDRLAADDPALGRFATVAALASLIPSSNLRRAGDLRFRRGREFDDVKPLVPLLATRLRIVANDLAAAPAVTAPAIFLTGDARRVGEPPPLGVDARVPTPPYQDAPTQLR